MPKLVKKKKNKNKPQRQYAVIIWDCVPKDSVNWDKARVWIQEIFKADRGQAEVMCKELDSTGRVCGGIYDLELAELKCEQIQSFRCPINGGKLTASLEKQ